MHYSQSRSSFRLEVTAFFAILSLGCRDAFAFPKLSVCRRKRGNKHSILISPRLLSLPSPGRELLSFPSILLRNTAALCVRSARFLMSAARNFGIWIWVLKGHGGECGCAPQCVSDWHLELGHFSRKRKEGPTERESWEERALLWFEQSSRGWTSSQHIIMVTAKVTPHNHGKCSSCPRNAPVFQVTKKVGHFCPSLFYMGYLLFGIMPWTGTALYFPFFFPQRPFDGLF